MGSGVDVLIICALRSELEALLEVRVGVVEGWSNVAEDPPYHVATFEGEHGRFRVAAARPTEMAGAAASQIAAQLAERLRPGSIAMCGVCAGHPDDTDLGDVIIADRVFHHDHGKRTKDGFEGDLRTYMPDDRWVRAAQDLEVLCAFLRRVVEPGSSRDTPPSEDPGRFEGPNPDAHFTGRVGELADLKQLVQANRTVCVVATGIGGIGKTTLVAEFAATCGRELFPDGVAWIDGSPQQFLGELGRACRRFGWTGDREPTPDEAQQHLKAKLAGQRVLLVVDNFDPANTPAKQVPIPGGKSRTLVTSRTRTLDLALDAKCLEFGVWPLDACREYLRSRCDRLVNTPDAEVDELAEFVGRLPLGVKLLVSVLRHRAGTPLLELLELLRTQPLGTLDKYDAGLFRKDETMVLQVGDSDASPRWGGEAAPPGSTGTPIRELHDDMRAIGYALPLGPWNADGHQYTALLQNTVKAFKARYMQNERSIAKHYGHVDKLIATMIKRVVAAYARGPV